MSLTTPYGLRLPSAEDMPRQLWLLWNGEGFVQTLYDVYGGMTYLVAFSEPEAIVAAEHQLNFYDVECMPVRIPLAT